MNKIALFLITSCAIFLATNFADGQVMPQYSKAVVYLDGKSISELGKIGIDISHGARDKDFSFQSDFSQRELEIITQAGFRYDILHEDVSKFYTERTEGSSAHSHSRNGSYCPEDLCVNLNGDPINFQLGSMRGFFTTEEIQNELFKMHLAYPHLVSFEKGISDFKTFENRPINYYKFTENPEQNHPNRPKILHTALHHAREGISVSQMIYFMWFLLENYDNNDIIKYILDHSELYFVPILNPDGYLFNERHYFSTGNLGMHRKNMREIELPGGGVTYGVDLNRNYGFNFGLNNTGSADDPTIETYRGPEEFSEPETQAIKWLCEQVPFDIALNHHSFGEYMLIPFGDNVTINPSYREFYALGKNMSECNEYLVGEPLELLAYETNGSSDDWMFGEVITKNSIFAFTPEIGNLEHGFWPEMSDIKPLCRDMLTMNINSVLSLLNFGQVVDMTPPYHHDINSTIHCMVNKLGVGQGNFEVRLEPLNNSIISGPQTKTINIQPFDSKEVIFNVQLRPDLDPNQSHQVAYVIHLDNGDLVLSDTTFTSFRPNKEILFEETSFTMNNWRRNGTSTWNIDDDFFTPFTSISDSPGVPYQGTKINTIQLQDPVRIDENADVAYLTFRAKYEIDYFSDFVQLSASTNGITGWTPLCGLFTQASKATGREGEPIYTGFQDDWIMEYIDLEDYKGQDIYLQWRMVSSERNNPRDFEGFFFDDLKIVTTGLLINTEETSMVQAEVYPNPSSGQFFVDIDSKTVGTSRLILKDALGKTVYSTPLIHGKQEIRAQNLSPGVYFYSIENVHHSNLQGKIFIQ